MFFNRGRAFLSPMPSFAGAVGLLQQLNASAHLSPQPLAIITLSSSHSYSGPWPPKLKPRVMTEVMLETSIKTGISQACLEDSLITLGLSVACFCVFCNTDILPSLPTPAVQSDPKSSEAWKAGVLGSNPVSLSSCVHSAGHLTPYASLSLSGASLVARW